MHSKISRLAGAGVLTLAAYAGSGLIPTSSAAVMSSPDTYAFTPIDPDPFGLQPGLPTNDFEFSLTLDSPGGSKIDDVLLSYDSGTGRISFYEIHDGNAGSGFGTPPPADGGISSDGSGHLVTFGQGDPVLFNGTFDNSGVSILAGKLADPVYIGVKFEFEDPSSDADTDVVVGEFRISYDPQALDPNTDEPFPNGQFTIDNISYQSTPGADLPEPGSLALLALGSTSLLARRRRA